MRRLMVVLLVLVAWSGGGLVPATAGTGPWVWPVDGPRQVSRAFAPPAAAYGTGHRGADLPAVTGAEVRAAGPGRVSYAGLLAGRGVVVVVHGSLRTTYEPVEAVVAVDEQVAAGQVVGTLAAGHDRCPSDACLHWGLRRGEAYLDPVRLVLAGPVRLLPVGGAAAAAGPRAGPTGASALNATPGASRTAGAATGAGPGLPVRASGPRAAVVARPPVVMADDRVRQAAATQTSERDAVPVSAERSPGLGLLALALLVAGLAVLARPRPSPAPPPPPAGSPARAVSPEPAPVRHHRGPDQPHGDDPQVHLPAADLLDLQAERRRRRGA